MNELGGRSMSSSLKTLKELLTHSDLSSIFFVDRIEAQSKDLIWANQTEQELFQLSYTSHKEGENNNSERAKTNNNTSSTCVEDINNSKVNTNLPHGFESVPLAYSDNQPTNHNSWNNQTNPILIFRTEETKVIDMNNIKLSLY